MDFEKFVREKIDCCACGESMKSSEHIYIVGLDKIATWDYPRGGNVLSEKKENRATSIVCDRCLDNRIHIRFAVEFKDNEVIYHDINGLADAPPLFPNPEVNCYGNLICPNCREEILVSFDVIHNPGLVHCPFCFKPFEITEELAKQANEISANYRELSKVKING